MGGILFILVIALVYFVPTIVAVARGARGAQSGDIHPMVPSLGREGGLWRCRGDGSRSYTGMVRLV